MGVLDVLDMLVMNPGCPAIGVLLADGINSLVQAWARAESVVKEESSLAEEYVMVLVRSICWSEGSKEGFCLSKSLVLLFSKRVRNHFHGKWIDILEYGFQYFSTVGDISSGS